jgi:hypothetical protein
MKRIALCLVFLVMSGCAALQTPQETKIAVSTLLDEIQVAINEINDKTKGTSLPPFKSAELTLSTKADKTTSGAASLVLSGKGSNVTTDSNVITLELVPNPTAATTFARSTGHEIAEHVIASVTAIDAKKFLKLNTLTVETGLEVTQIAGGGIKVELVGVTVESERSKSSTTGHTLKLVFAQPEKTR